MKDEEIRMAKEMGLNLLSLIKNIPAPNQLWKAPVKQWIREMYEERLEKSARRALLKKNAVNPTSAE